MKKKICLTTLEFPPDVGGVGESAHRIAQMLLDFGYEVHVAVFRGVFRKEKAKAIAGEYKRSNLTTTEQNGIVVHRLKPAIRSSVAGDGDYLADIYLQLKNLHQKYKFDLFHAFFINETGFISTLLAKENNLPVINSVRGADLHKHIFNPQQHGQITWILENSSWTTFVSRDLMNRARVLVPNIEAKSSAFWNSVNPINFEGLPTPKLADRLQGIVIGSVGRFRDKKGLEYLFDACCELKSEIDLTLLLVGDFVEKEMEYWQAEIDNSNLGDRLVVTGTISRSEALTYLPYIDIFAIPSLSDGCPNALLEAMLAGKAIVGTQVDAIGEIIEPEKDGLLVNPSSSQELAAAMRKLSSNSQMRQSFGAAAQKKAYEQLAPSVEKQNWHRVYQEVLGTSAESILGSATLV
ncbi:MAG: glycosyltransferase [Prochloraceae cyanobacterium]|nr:glycosyltransferase [Prochloraceae cyanobacterium]